MCIRDSSCTDTTKFLSDGKCVAVCPSGTIPQSKTCQPCQTPCATCVDSTSKCTSCVNGYNFIVSNNTCQSQCPTGLFLQSGNCVGCDTSVCKTCTGTPTNCTSCDSSSNTPFLLNNKCVPASQCPTNSFADTSTGTCRTCTSPCSTCKNQTSCTKCLLDGANQATYLFGDKCVVTCPAGSVAIGDQCLNCTAPCTTCSGGQSQCTSCRDPLAVSYTHLTLPTIYSV
eukprot:TRINITY_DN23571_c0_g1_i2.p1 TRINITY_DN23571_c0_g1~~TRINITY_DN23571_c0_g1_i2.p1  ORF type:complete len:246 (+),score=8.28 TRINITY_DN23571_c0_g1_i2:60-740(+)